TNIMTKFPLCFLISISIFFISFKPVKPQTENESPPDSPPAGYINIRNYGYYKFHEQKVDWHLASFVCRREGARLVVLNSEAEANKLKARWNLPESWAWIGIHDLYEEGVYVTIYNQTLEEAGYSKVQPGELNGGTSENCGGMTKDALLVNHWCHAPLQFICEFKE
ncbi:hypothetical protein L9F63_014960, partial [Diploptera punctata]